MTYISVLFKDKIDLIKPNQYCTFPSYNLSSVKRLSICACVS